jgi:regulator of sigma E protease
LIAGQISASHFKDEGYLMVWPVLEQGSDFVQTLIAAIIVFGIIIFVHEFGHFIMAKLTGVRVEEFSLGMGPLLLGHKRGETKYSLRAIPIGGYCKMTGENYEAEEEVPEHKRFDKKPVWARMSIIVAGSFMNILLAVVIFALLYSAIGIPKDFGNTIGQVEANSVAEAGGLQAGDRITKINDQSVKNWTDITKVIHNYPNQELTLEIQRGQEKFTVALTPRYNEELKIGIIGITPSEQDIIFQKTGVLNGIRRGFEQTFAITRLMLEQLGMMVTGKVAADGVAGPVGIIQLIGQSAAYGFFYVANFTAIISINLGIINMLPIPALDGSRFLFLLYEGIFRRRINPEKENFVHLIGFALLIMLMVFITYQDVARIARSF